METIQSLKTITFRRDVIPEDVVNTQVELLVATNASQNLGSSPQEVRLIQLPVAAWP
jgi:hypothetical protein